MDEKIRRIEKIAGDSPFFPISLSALHHPPTALYCLGDISLLQTEMAAIVGSRKCSPYGRQTAMRLGGLLAEAEMTTVSGMAAGIDSFGHIGALEKGGKTVAVLGCGVDICYPPGNKKLYQQIIAEGLVIAEYPPGYQPRPYCFPQRNRIIAALSEAVAVVEARPNSGALITAELAEELGKMVYAVPGNISSACSLGTNKLIADGAMVLVTAEDFVRGLGKTPRWHEREEAGLSTEEKAIIAILRETGEVTLDELCRRLNKNPVELSGIVAVLEIKGRLITDFGKIFLANS